MTFTTLFRKTKPKSLFDRIGGNQAISLVLDIFYARVMHDEQVKHFFYNKDMEKLKARHKAFLAMAMGGPVNYSGHNLRAAHAPMVSMGLDDCHFDIIVFHLTKTLRELGIDDGLILEVYNIAQSVRADVLGQND